MRFKRPGDFISRLSSAPLTATQLRVCLAWASHQPQYDPGTRKLSEQTGLDRRNVWRALKDLCAKNILEKVGRDAEGRDKYRLHPEFFKTEVDRLNSEVEGEWARKAALLAPRRPE